MPELEVSGLCAGYAAMQVVHDVTLRLSQGEVVALIGRNGAGKTTTLQAICGLRFGPSAGTVRVDEAEITSRNASEMSRLGLALVPEGHRIFAGMTVAENLKLGAYPVRKLKGSDISRGYDRVFGLFPDLHAARSRPAEQLSGGQQQMLAIAQALMSNARFVLLDEPCAGLAPAVVDRIYRAVEALAADSCGVLVVEQDVKRGMRRSQRTYVMDRGSVLIEGASAALSADGRVLDLIRGIMRGDDQVEPEGDADALAGKSGDGAVPAQ